MAVMARIGNNWSVPVNSLKIERKLNEIGTFEFEILARLYTGWLTAEGLFCEILVDGETFVSGLIDKAPGVKKISPESPLVVDFSAEDELSLLNCYLRKNNAHYQDQSVIAILGDLLTMTDGDWVLDTTTVVDPTVVTTGDLRSKEKLFSQIATITKQVPHMHLRYGGRNASNKHILEVGDFSVASAQLLQGYNLSQINRDINLQRSYSAVAAIGEGSGNNVITLSEALNDARTTVHADYVAYPIQAHPITGELRVVNVNATIECETVQKFKTIKTENATAPTYAERAEAGFALWQQSVRFLEAHQPYESYSVDAYLESAPQVGNRARLTGSISEPVKDQIGRTVEQIETFAVDDLFRITEWSVEIESPAVLQGTLSSTLKALAHEYAIELASRDDVEDMDGDVAAYKRLEDTTGIDAEALTFSVDSQFQYQTGVAADCDTATGRTFTISPDLSKIPDGATSVVTSVTLNPGNYTVFSETPPASPGDDWTGCIKPPTPPWGVGSACTVTVLFVYR